MQGSFADQLCTMLVSLPSAPRYMFKLFLEVMLQSADFLGGITPPSETRVTLTEFRNKLQAFYLFQYADCIMGLTSGTNLTLPQMTECASDLGSFSSVWATEGLGRFYTRMHTRGDQSPRQLLCGSNTAGVQRQGLVALHTGMGLALAELALNQFPESRTLAEHFIDFCQSNSRPGYVGCAIEGLGLVVRNLRPDLVAALDREFAGRDEELLAFFWHGVGRGVYFTLANSLPYCNTPWRGYEICMTEPPQAIGRINAVAGFAWALTLVNIRNPEILATFLKRYHTKLSDDDAFANGVFSALVIWLESAPKDSSVVALCEYEPVWLGPSLLQLWHRIVGQAARDALHLHHNLTSDVSTLFRYQPFWSQSH